MTNYCWPLLITALIAILSRPSQSFASGICGSPPDLEYETGVESRVNYSGLNATLLASGKFDSLLNSWINCEIFEQLGGSNFVLGTYLAEMIGSASTQVLTHSTRTVPNFTRAAGDQRQVNPRIGGHRSQSGGTVTVVRSTTIERPPFFAAASAPLLGPATGNFLSDLNADVAHLRAQFPRESCQQAMTSIPNEVLRNVRLRGKAGIISDGDEILPPMFKTVRYCIDDRHGRSPDIIQRFVLRELDLFMQDPVAYYEAKIQSKQILNVYVSASVYFGSQLRNRTGLSEHSRANLENNLNLAIMFAVASGLNNDILSFYVEKAKTDAIADYTKNYGWGNGLVGTFFAVVDQLLDKPINIAKMIAAYYIGLGITDQLTWLNQYPPVQAAVGQSIASGLISASDGGSLRNFSRQVLISALSAGVAQEVALLAARNLNAFVSPDTLNRFHSSFRDGLQTTLNGLGRNQSVTNFLPSLVANSLSAELQTLLRVPGITCSEGRRCFQSPLALVASNTLASYSNHIIALMLGVDRHHIAIRMVPQPSLRRRNNQCLVAAVPNSTAEDCPIFSQDQTQVELTDSFGLADGISFDECNSEAQGIANLCRAVSLSYFPAGALAVTRTLFDNGGIVGTTAPQPISISVPQTPPPVSPSIPSSPSPSQPSPQVPAPIPPIPLSPVSPNAIGIPAPASQVSPAPAIPQTSPFVCRPGLIDPSTGQRCPLINAPQLPIPKPGNRLPRNTE